MANKICGKTIVVPKNGLKMEYVPQGLYKTSIQIFLRTIMNHHKKYIFSECMKLVIHWVADVTIHTPFLLSKRLHYVLWESKLKRVKFIYPGKMKQIIDMYRPNAV